MIPEPVGVVTWLAPEVVGVADGAVGVLDGESGVVALDRGVDVGFAVVLDELGDGDVGCGPAGVATGEDVATGLPAIGAAGSSRGVHAPASIAQEAIAVSGSRVDRGRNIRGPWVSTGAITGVTALGLIDLKSRLPRPHGPNVNPE